MNRLPKRIEQLEELSGPYSVILSDVWGVVHNGVRAHREACEALARLRAGGKAVVMITNSPRRHLGVEQQFRTLSVRQDCWDRIVTSGDVTRDLITSNARRIYHIGPERDLAIYDGLDVELVEERDANAVCCTGLFDDNESPEDYADMLQRLRSRDLPFICANPDIVVEYGDELIWCAGALARDYGQLGGRTLIAGKPFRPIYEAAFSAAAEIVGRSVDPTEVLAIGDGLLTDIKGANNAGVDSLFISGGIHAGEYGGAAGPDAALLGAFLETHDQWPAAFMPQLR